MSSKSFLPHGDILKMFLLNSSLPKSELKGILRDRGVFFGEEDRDQLVTFLVRTGLSPSEFDILLNCLKIRDENPKVRTQSIASSENESSIRDALDNNGFNLRKIVDDSRPFSNYTIVGIPNVKSVDNNPNHIEISFSLDCRDLTKSWERQTERNYPPSLTADSSWLTAFDACHFHVHEGQVILTSWQVLGSLCQRYGNSPGRRGHVATTFCPGVMGAVRNSPISVSS